MRTIKNSVDNVVKIYAETFEHAAYTQIKQLADYKAYQNSTICIMPDAHAGKGCTVGTTMTIDDCVTPALVGSDIGCGMLAVELEDTEIDFAKLDALIRSKVAEGGHTGNYNKKSLNLDKLCCLKHIDTSAAIALLGSLGGGNHFIEVDKSEESGRLFLVIHTGSRKLGGLVCNYYQALADKTCNGGSKDQVAQADRDFAFLKGKDMKNYLNDMDIVQQFAVANRDIIANLIIKELGLSEVSRFQTIHNYIEFSRKILRKGAVSAEEGEKLLIPINMRDGALICIGKGNPDWNYSAPHGAGRLMSRGKAKEAISYEEYEESMKGIYSSSVSESSIDESPQAYKSIDEIRYAITDTVDIVETIKPVYNYKSTK